VFCILCKDNLFRSQSNIQCPQCRKSLEKSDIIDIPQIPNEEPEQILDLPDKFWEMEHKY